ncbi:L-alanine-DL-glutamate epimerase-like enolase superfamily enzyme [Humitalea rosea]|uniref:L-alanine-DL-glutamate epimerase-like enolase superfamily enzyme n=1 Tax=Humitalea rosea TaxID=990373 RepID=A0A2W7I1P7_9PROT|nr:mandelate racemase/muconate lactonizing enzyme family protein [Humitalea rosea]PZW39362.1 L-alanine-DL-glutamate epimerase-like enolase superfamily enzyme [Humitalea rosea]
MKIIRIETRMLRSAFTYGAGSAGFGGNLRLREIETLLVRVETEDGLHGWGEGFGFSLGETTKDAVDRLIGPACIGLDGSDIAGVQRLLLRRFHNFGRHGPVRYGISAIDVALWDLAGKRAGKPLHALLGNGGRARVPAYASLLRYGEPTVVAANVAEAIRLGYRQIKLHEVDLACIRAARAAAPPEVPLMLDINCTWERVEEAVGFCRAVEGMNIRWVEEPVWPPEDFAAMGAVRAAAGCGIAAGENLGGPEDFARLIAARAVDFVQPSVTKHGGLTAMVEVAAMARAAGIAVVPHSPYFGPGLLATLHWLAAADHEEPLEIYFAELATPPFGAALAAQEGFVTVPDGPGLGLEPDI